MRHLLPIVALLAAFLGLALVAPAFAQQGEEEEKGRFVRFVEDKLSSDTAQIRLNGLEGSLSSNVRLQSITVADQDGVYLTIENPVLEWNRSALLRGKLDVERLAAERIVFERTPRADESLPDPEAGPFALPDLPVEIEIEEIAVPRIEFGETVFGLAATAGINGRILFDDGRLDADLRIERLDGPGGQLAAKVSYADGSDVVIDVVLDEPQNGIVANLLNIPGTPPVRLAIQGAGPVANLTTDITLDADGERVLGGQVVTSESDDGTRIVADVNGPLASLLPERLRPFVGGESRLSADVVLREAGGTLINMVSLDSGAVDLDANGLVLADGFLSALNVDLNLRDNDGERVTLDLADRQVSLADAGLTLRYDAARQEGWNGSLKLADLRTAEIRLGEVDLEANGTVTSLQDAANRAVAFNLEGEITGIEAADAALREALGDRITVSGSGSTKGDEPVALNDVTVAGDTFRAVVDGRLRDLVYEGDLALRSDQLQAFSALANRPLGGETDVTASGTVGFVSGQIDLVFDGTATDLEVGIARVDPLLAGRTTLAGRASRGANGLLFENLRIVNDQAEIALDGRFASDFANLRASGRIADVALVEPQAKGEVTFEASVDGEGEPPFRVVAQVAMASGELAGRRAENLRLRFEGTTDGERVDGDLSADGSIGGETVSLASRIAASAERQSLQALDLTVGATNATGDVVRNEAGLLDGRLRIASTDISALAALALQEGSGAVNGTLELSATDGTQSATADITANDLRVAGYRLDSADIDARARDLFGKPAIDATLDAAGIEAAGVIVRKLDGRVATEGNRTTFDVDATLAQADATLSTRGAVVQEDARLTVELEELSGTAQGADIRLREPATVTVENGTTRFSDIALAIGEGAARLSGSVGETLDVTADIERLPLDIANAVAPGLDLGGRVSGSARVTGTPAAPEATFSLNGAGLSARALREAGIEPVNVKTQGSFANDVVVIDNAAVTNGQGVNASVSGRVPLSGEGEIALDASLSDLPLALANTFAPNLDLRGRVSGTARIGGTIAAPNATFDVSGQSLSARPLVEAGVAPVDLVARGAFRDRVLALDALEASNGQGLFVSASGRVPTDGGAIALDATVREFPLGLANAFTSGLDLTGRASGTARVTGTASRPDVVFDVTADGVSARPLAQNGVAPLTIAANGRYADDAVVLQSARASNPQGVSLQASGRVPLDGGQIDVSASLDRLPLSVVNAARPGLGLEGAISGTAQVTGRLADPAVAFDLSGSGISAAPIRQANVAPLSVSAAGRFANGEVSLDRASASNGQGISVSASGRIPLSGSGLSVQAEGTAPASIANGFLANRGTSVSGTARFDVFASGSLQDPNVEGLASLSGGTVVDPLSNLRLEGVGALASLRGDEIVINEARARLSTGGSVSVSGTVGIAGSQPVNLTVHLDDARYTDGETFTTVASGTLTLTGLLAADPLLSGAIELDRTEITVPENFGGSADLLDVRHVAPPLKVRRTLERLNAATPVTSPSSRPSIIRLDVLINAPNRIFVRGRGLDAELGGSVRVRGPINGVRPEGRFELIRGRLSIIGRRIELDEGTITLTGDLDPTLDFVARVQADDVTAFIRLRGRVSDLEVTFDSQPELPEDEVLAQVVFGRSVTDLSPAQIARLASIAAELTGGSSPGLVDGIRAGTGLDDLDVTTDASGNAAVQAGKYISDNVYLGVTAGRESEATINLDITDDITARGSVGTSGNSQIGIFFEKDY